MIRLMGKNNRLAGWLIVAVLIFTVAAPLSAWADVKTVTGVVVEKDGENVIQTPEGIYILDGYVDEFIGKKVEVSGELAKDDAGAWIILVDAIGEME